MLSSLLATKRHRPRPTSNLVAQPWLPQRFDEGLRHGHRPFLAVAPAGYGSRRYLSSTAPTRFDSSPERCSAVSCPVV
jgi:ATP/maltotriose-dependent transcriptional regulator MalT